MTLISKPRLKKLAPAPMRKTLGIPKPTKNNNPAYRKAGPAPVAR